MFNLSELFNDGDPPHTSETTEGGTATGTGLKNNDPMPLSPRLSCGFCGIFNQGATCYLNSLLQTLFMTPEFRVSLFKLGSKELDVLSNREKPGHKVRVIPLQLQTLFSRLLLLDAQAVSTTELTDSFGWTNNEGLIQHDVQELNRILFSAIEDSLVGTSGQNIINKLYHGCLVNQIVCQVCGKISEREEVFLDLCVAVSGSSGLEESLSQSYVHTEALDGDNCYHCEACNKLVNAKKGAKIRHLPPLLTISLLRFSFDYRKLERFKETGKFTFPLEIDMGPYVENLVTAGNTEYELYSVVNHSGGAHGGHYTAYIRDLDSLGQWTHPDDETIQLAPDPGSGKVDFIECDSPVDLIHAILSKADDKGMPVDKLCAEINKQTGVSWNKRFKRQHGPINKFLRKYNDKFVVSDLSYVQLVSLSAGSSGTEGRLQNDTSSQNSKHPQASTSKTNRPKSPVPPRGSCWFEFNDSKIHPVRSSVLEQQYSGKSSAYMLFYHMKGMAPQSSMGSPKGLVPEYLLQQIDAENEKLEQQRNLHELSMNTVIVRLLFPQMIRYTRGALQVNDESLCFLELSIDRRKTISELLSAIRETYGELTPDVCVVHYAKLLAAGIHVYHSLSDKPNTLIADAVMDHRCRLLVWDGSQINGEEIPIGIDKEPIQITISHGSESQIKRGFPKLLTLGELRLMVCSLAQLDPDTTTVNRVSIRDEETCITELHADENGKTLQEVQLINGDKLLLKSSSELLSTSPEEAVAVDKDIVCYLVQNRCIGVKGDDWPLIPVRVNRHATVENLKSIVISELAANDLNFNKCRLRPESDDLGLLPPVHETQSLTDAGLRPNSRVILELGLAPLTNQLSLTFSCAAQDGDQSPLEVIVGRNTLIRELLGIMVTKANKQGEKWHLRRTNWCGEATGILDDMDSTLGESQLNNGDHLLLEEGQLPPKGFVKLNIKLFPGVESPESSKTSAGIMSWITEGLQGLLTSKSESGESCQSVPVDLGSVVVAKETIIEDLKLIILTLPNMENLAIPTVDFLRLRLVEQNHMTSVLKDQKQTLQRQKVTNGMTLGVQLLQSEENLSNNDILVEYRLRIPESRSYESACELVCDTSQGATLSRLRQVIADRLLLPSDRLVLARYFPDRYEWLEIKEEKTNIPINNKSKGRRGKKTRQPKVNLRNAPYKIKDGVIIGVKDLEHDPLNKDDFSTQFDLDGKEKLQQEADEHRKRREEMRAANAAISSGCPPRRKEQSIKIHVDDFR